MGAIRDTYLRYEATGDQYVGIVIAGLPIYSWKFTILPPQIVDCCFPSLPEGLKYSARFLTASILYHLDEVMKHVPSSHPLLLAPFLTSTYIKEMIQKIRVDCAWDEDVDVEVYSTSITATEASNKKEVEEVSGELLGSISRNGSSVTVSLGSEKTMLRRTQRI